jgi:hypothetical protein
MSPTFWSERVAVLGRGQAAMEAGFNRMVERLPFAVIELHPDNGSEFFNHQRVALLEGQGQGGATLAQPSLPEKR